MAGSPQIGRPAGAHNSNRPGRDLPTEWMESRACTADDKALFFSENDPSRLSAKFAELEAKAICHRCTVQVACLEFAIAADEYGIWGGTTRDERLKRKKAAVGGRVRAVRPPAP